MSSDVTPASLLLLLLAGQGGPSRLCLGLRTRASVKLEVVIGGLKFATPNLILDYLTGALIRLAKNPQPFEHPIPQATTRVDV